MKKVVLDVMREVDEDDGRGKATQAGQATWFKSPRPARGRRSPNRHPLSETGPDERGADHRQAEVAEPSDTHELARGAAWDHPLDESHHEEIAPK